MDDKIEAWVREGERLMSDFTAVLVDGFSDCAAAVKADAAMRAHLRTTPEGYRLVKDSTWESRCWPEDFDAENGNYSNECNVCMRQFMGNKHRRTCKSCAMLAASQESGT